MFLVRNISLTVVFLAGVMPLRAAEIQLHDVCHISSNIVKMSDIADVYDTDQALAERLADTELCLAPTLGSRRTLTSRQIRDHGTAIPVV